jgi:hypothetical protein
MAEPWVAVTRGPRFCATNHKNVAASCRQVRWFVPPVSINEQVSCTEPRAKPRVGVSPPLRVTAMCLVASVDPTNGT